MEDLLSCGPRSVLAFYPNTPSGLRFLDCNRVVEIRTRGLNWDREIEIRVRVKIDDRLPRCSK